MKIYHLLSLISLFSSVALANSVSTQIQKTADNEWFVQYKAESAVEKLVFRRTPNQSRAKRWTPTSVDFIIGFEAGKEVIQRKDGKPFTQSTFQLTPTYISLPKDYAPFSPFSDGGMLLHSGRFFVCANQCDAELNSWEIALKVPENENVVVNGKVHSGAATWQDKNSGRKVYVGPGKPIQDEYFVSVIDKKLPAELANQMADQLPGLMDYFSQKLGSLNFTPTMFASFSDTQNGGYGNQGGTLNDQIFMHWYGEQAISGLDGTAVYWFFAHEVAHLHQKSAGRITQRHHAWIHEGSAEYFASQTMADKQFVAKKFANAEKHCSTALSKNDDYIEASAANSRLHYSCGLLIFEAIAKELKAQNSEVDVFELWQSFNQLVEQGKPASAATFLPMIKPHVSSQLMDLLSRLTSGTPVKSLEPIVD